VTRKASRAVIRANPYIIDAEKNGGMSRSSGTMAGKGRGSSSSVASGSTGDRTADSQWRFVRRMRALMTTSPSRRLHHGDAESTRKTGRHEGAGRGGSKPGMTSLSHHHQVRHHDPPTALVLSVVRYVKIYVFRVFLRFFVMDFVHKK